MPQEQAVFQRTKVLLPANMHYCPGCTHGVAHRLIAETIDELGIQDKTIGISPVGCSVFIYDYINIDWHQASHGRAPAVASGARRALPPDRYIFTYQGDGDLASIGMAEIIHAANRGEKITVIFLNNAIYGMTGGQMAPTSLPGMRTTTSPQGRDTEQCGHPVRMCEMLNTLVDPKFIARGALTSPKHIQRSKKIIRQAFELQHQGFTFVELLSICPTGWGLAPSKAAQWLESQMTPFYPLLTFREPGNMPAAAQPYQMNLESTKSDDRK